MGNYGHADGSIEHYRTKDVLWGDAPLKWELKPCRECGAVQKKTEGPTLWYVGCREGQSGYRVICSKCDFLLNDILWKTEKEAVDDWNRGNDI